MTIKKISSIDKLEELGRVRLSKTFFMRDFLYSEIANWYGLQNFPDNPNMAIYTGTQLCQQLLEPLQDKFGRLEIRSAYRSCDVNQIGNENNHNCGSNEKNYASHIWDHADANGHYGATACIVIPSLVDLIKKDNTNWKQIAYWIHNHLPYSRMEFFKRKDTLCAFNLSWHEQPKKEIYSYIRGDQGNLKITPEPNAEYEKFYTDLREYL